MRGELLRVSGRYDEALGSLDRALELRPDFAWARGTRGQVLHHLRRHEAALVDLDDALKQAPQLSWARYVRIEALRALGREPQAVAELASTAESNPRDARDYVDRGYAFEELGHIDEAIDCYLHAVELAPWHRVYQNNLAELYLSKHDLDHAEERYRLRVSLRNDDALNAYVGLGVIALVKGDEDAARKSFRDALDVVESARKRGIQSAENILENQALALLGLGREEEALSELVRAIENLPPGRHFDRSRYTLLNEAAIRPPGVDEFLQLIEPAFGPAKDLDGKASRSGEGVTAPGI